MIQLSYHFQDKINIGDGQNVKCTGWAKEKYTITNSKLFGYVIYKLALKLDKNTQ